MIIQLTYGLSDYWNQIVISFHVGNTKKAHKNTCKSYIQTKKKPSSSLVQMSYAPVKKTDWETVQRKY